MALLCQKSRLSLLLSSCFTLVELALSFGALTRRATKVKGKIDASFLGVPCEIYYKIPILQLPTYLISTKVNMRDAQQRESI